LTDLKGSAGTCSIPVILIADIKNVENEIKAFLIGAADYFTRPFEKELFTARVSAHLKTAAQMKKFEQLGFIDALTNIPNRRKFDNHMETEWCGTIKNKLPVSVIMIDIDSFKLFNDTYGHPQGDAVLRTVAETILSSLGRNADFVARWGGEEFVVILPRTESEGAVIVAERIRQNIEETLIDNMVKGEPALSVTVSLGVTTTKPDIEIYMSDMIRHADFALYKAKKAGKNKVCVYEPGDEIINEGNERGK